MGPLLRRWAPWVVLVVVAAVALTFGSQRHSQPSLDARVQSIASLVRCPVCNGETVAASQAAPSVEIRQQIRDELVAGESQGQIINGLVQVYGPWILEKPRAGGVDLLLWVVPILGGIAGALAVMAVIRRWRRPPVPVPTADPRVPPARPPWRPPAPHRWVVVLGAVAVLAGAGVWAGLAATSPRAPGAPITGGVAAATSANGAQMAAAAAAAAKGDAVGAVKIYAAILAKNPGDVNALTAEGWLLAQTQQPALLGRGISLLARAEKDDPAYGPAHLYRGIAFLSEDDYSDAVPELEWYLGHHPDPQLVGPVGKALAQAKAGLGRSA